MNGKMDARIIYHYERLLVVFPLCFIFLCRVQATFLLIERYSLFVLIFS